MEKISANELLDLLNNQWANTDDIMKIGCIGKNQALKIKREIAQDLINNGYYLPRNLVTMESVISYFKINIKHLRKISSMQKGNHYDK